MATKKSVVKSVQATGTWDSKKEPIRTFYKHEIQMENGDMGEYSSTSQEQTKFQEGEEVQYTFHPGDFPKIKPYYEPFNSTGDAYNVNYANANREQGIARSVALKCATEYAVAFKQEIQELIDTAKIMEGFLNEGTQPTEKETDDKAPF